MSANWDTPPLKRRRSGAAMLVPLAIVIGVGIVGMYVVRDVKHHGIGIAGPSPAQGLTNAVSGLNTTINALAVQAQLAQALDHSTTNYVQRISCTLRRSSGKGTEAARDRYLCVVAYFRGPQRRWCATFDRVRSDLSAYSPDMHLCSRA